MVHKKLASRIIWLMVAIMSLALIVGLGISRPFSILDQNKALAAGVDIDLSQVPKEMQSAFTSVVAGKPDSILPGQQLAVVSLRVEGDWALATIAMLDNTPEDVGMGDDGALVMLRKKVDGAWDATLQGTIEFEQMVAGTPETLLDSTIKQTFVLPNLKPQSMLYANMKFPWDSSQSWKLTQGWHSGNNVDLAPASSEPNKWVLAAHDGTVTRICNGEASANVQVQHSDGTKTTYVHLDKNSFQFHFRHVCSSR
jgi:hypothetical protein